MGSEDENQYGPWLRVSYEKFWLEKKREGGGGQEENMNHGTGKEYGSDSSRTVATFRSERKEQLLREDSGRESEDFPINGNHNGQHTMGKFHCGGVDAVMKEANGGRRGENPGQVKGGFDNVEDHRGINNNKD